MPLQIGKAKLRKSIRYLDEEVWLEGIDFLLSMKLPDLELQCPKCGRKGVPGPKWVRGPKIKPLYMFHKNGKGQPDSCALDPYQAQVVREQVYVSEEDLKTLLANARPYVLFSGGSDSLCTLDYLSTLAAKVGRKVTALHASTTVGFPEVAAYVRRVCDKLGVELEVVQPQVDYFTLARRWGIPGINCRWCCRELKIRPIMDFLANIHEPKMVFDGIRAAESTIRAKYVPIWFHPSFNCLAISAIFHWSDEDVENYIAQRELLIEASSQLNTSAECWCGAYKTKQDFKELYRSNPDMFAKLRELEENNKAGFTFVYEKGRRVRLEDIEKQAREEHICRHSTGAHEGLGPTSEG